MKINGYSIQKLTVFIIAWYILHIIAAHLYTKFCVPLTMWGMILAPFMTTASHCIILRWTITHGGHATMIAWGMITVWLSNFIFD